MDLKETDILGDDIDNHWYYKSKAKATTRLLEGVCATRILDVGAGSGFFSRYLLSNTVARESWCVDTSYKSDFDENQASKIMHYRRSVGVVNADLVLFMDVLEHVDNDVELLKEYVDKVPRGCQFLISVPAFQFLWSGHDEFLDHKRRYTLNQLEATAREASLNIKRSSYYFGGVFPIAALLRLTQAIGGRNTAARSQLSKHSPIVNGILKLICYSELPIMRFNRLAGLTAFCLAEKQ